MYYKQSRKSQSGATMVEFIITAPIVLLLGLGSVQAGLVYHGKATLNYATFEAARAGAVDHAQLDSMKSELGFRLAPLVGGDGSPEKAAEAIAMSMAGVNLPLQTKLEILSPTVEAFDDWGQISREAGVRAIPNSHLRNRHDDRSRIGAASGLNLHDANLLKIRVTHGFQLKIPILAGLYSDIMMELDSDNAGYYALRQIPITSVVTVRMQNEAWESHIVAATTAAPLAEGGNKDNQLVDTNQSNAVAVTPCADRFGLTGQLAMLSNVEYPVGLHNSQICGTDAFVNNSNLVSTAISAEPADNDQFTPLESSDADGCS